MPKPEMVSQEINETIAKDKTTLGYSILDYSTLIPGTDIKVGMTDYLPSRGQAKFFIIEGGVLSKFKLISEIRVSQNLPIINSHEFKVVEVGDEYLILKINDEEITFFDLNKVPGFIIDSATLVPGTDVKIGAFDYNDAKNTVKLSIIEGGVNTNNYFIKNLKTGSKISLPFGLLKIVKKGSDYFIVDYNGKSFTLFDLNKLNPSVLDLSFLIPGTDIKIGMFNYNPSIPSANFAIIEGGVVTKYYPDLEVQAGVDLNLLTNYDIQVIQLNPDFITISVNGYSINLLDVS